MTTARVTATPARAYHGLRACPKCDIIYSAAFTADRDDVCPDCKRAEARETLPKREGVRVTKGSARFFTVLAAIDCFRAGDQFDTTDFAASLLNEAWPPGMRLERDGQTYTVIPGGMIQSGETTYRIQNNGKFVATNRKREGKLRRAE